MNDPRRGGGASRSRGHPPDPDGEAARPKAEHSGTAPAGAAPTPGTPDGEAARPEDEHSGTEPTILDALADATVLGAADVHTARVLARLAGDAEEAVQLAAALAVRAVRLGHVYVDLPTAAATVSPDNEDVDVDLAALPWPDAQDWPARVAASPLTAVGGNGPADRPLRLVGSHLYLDRYWRYEQAIVEDLRDRAQRPPPTRDEDTLAAGLARLFPDAGPDDAQRRAAATAVERRFTVIAGGPGTGKTTTVARILALLHEQAAALGQPPPRIALAAPTGKAAARLAEAVHDAAPTLDTAPAVRSAVAALPAVTLHRLLGWQPGSRSRFRHDTANQLPHQVVIVDECSMVGLSMMARLLAAVRRGARLVLVGDPRQLASVEAGAVLGDIVGSGLPGIVTLRRTHRYGGGIAELAGAIEGGDGDAVIEVLASSPADVEWLAVDPEADGGAPPPASVRAAVIECARTVVAAARAGDGEAALDALGSVQVLCAHRQGPAGVTRWRADIERWLRTAIAGYGGEPWYAGRPLLVTANDYSLGVYNGDTGVVIDDGGGRLRAVFSRSGGLLSLPPTRLSSVESLYAMTIHKAQGSQFGTVIVQLPGCTSRALTRELLYTAVTRPMRRLVLIGTEEAIRSAVARPVARASGLPTALS